MKIYTLGEILKTEHLGDEKYVRYEDVEQADIKSGIKQPLEGLLYDLDWMPEQIKSAINDLRREVVECQYRENERLKKALEEVQSKSERQGCNHSGCDDKWHTAQCPVGYMQIAQQALKEGE